ncbi:hypothetical protein BPC006_I0443 [Burkholderia pseudomallei BPC006]|nr:hypothetical protein BPC006_I0443 [Burkholderia pseudomallei BPC006]
MDDVARPPRAGGMQGRRRAGAQRRRSERSD